MLNRLRHNMRSRMTQRQPPPRILESQKLHGGVLFDRRRQADGSAVKLRRQHFFRQTVAHRLDKIEERRPLRRLANTAVF